MKHKTDIEWTHVPGYVGATLNPIRARNKETGKVGWFCVHASDGCRNCYAEALNNRFGTSISFKAQHRDQVEPFLDENILLRPLKWKKPHAIFLCDMTDMFEDGHPDEWLDKIFAIAALCPHHIFMVLTKRAKRMMEYLGSVFSSTGVCRRWVKMMAEFGDRSPPFRVPLHNIWLGVSAEDQDRADERIPDLLATPAAVRFVSVEPMLGPITLERWLPIAARGNRYERVKCEAAYGESRPRPWTIIGGESGPNARPFDIQWARSITAQCRAAGTACFVKQIGSKPQLHGFTGMPIKDRKGGDPAEWPEDLRVRQFPLPAQ